MVRGRLRVVLCLMSLCASAAWAEEKEPAAIIELGGAGEWDFPQGKFGPSAAIEFTPIKDWLEIEAGISRCSAAVKQNGAPIFYSKSPSPCPTPLNL